VNGHRRKATVDGQSERPPWAAAVDERHRPLRTADAEAQQTSALAVRCLGRRTARIGDGPHWPSAALGGGRFRLGGGQLIEEAVCLISSLPPSFNHIGCAATALGTCCYYVVEGGGPLCYHIHTVLLSTL
jgi:hypothetical protein